MLRLVASYLSKKDSPQTTPSELPSEVASQRYLIYVRLVAWEPFSFTSTVAKLIDLSIVSKNIYFWYIYLIYIIATIHELSSGVSGRAMSSAWRSLLEAHEVFARQHIELSEQHLYQSSEPLRIFRARKAQLLKRGVGAQHFVYFCYDCSLAFTLALNTF